ncbi:MAG: MFS transporter [Myxococcales bacterium]|nr:MFS transporter [Myxococcales bacterium]
MTLDRVRDRNIRLVYLTILLLGVAYGLAISLVAVFLEEKGFDKTAIGQLAIFFAGGIVAFAIPAGSMIKAFGAKRVLIASLLGYAAAVGLFPFVNGYWSVGALRFFDGAFSVGVWVSSETILLARAPREDKAYCTSLYAIALALGYVIGPFLASAVVALTNKATSFMAAGALSVLTALVVGALLDSRVTSHGAEESAGEGGGSLTTGQVFWRIKMSCLATFSYGYFQASVVLFLPLYLIERGITEHETIIMPAFFALGMLLFANFAAQQGDCRGHLAMMRLLGIVGTLTVIAFLFVPPVGVIVYAVGFVAGASLASVSPVSLALQGLVIPERELSRAGGLYNAAYALGMLVGPPIAGALFTKLGGPAMITHFAVLWALFVALTIVFRRDDPRVAASG